ncbi:MAG: 50S ribosomal protein L18 [Elusimicrobiota bacterium]|nr:50S ribosomal protein L18 [Endomicrobiia bacterium]MDW8165494.1 50S ribosomal protein L18 [Elusimicrobiota bacterium]
MNIREAILPKIRLQRRKLSIRKKIFGTKERPRVSVYRSLKHIYAQAIDDERGHTIASCSTLCKQIRQQLENKTKTEKAKIVGIHLGEKLTKLGIKKIVFDRNGRKYIGRIQALAEGLRSVGIEF